MSNTLAGGWISVDKNFENEWDNTFRVGELKFEVVLPDFEGIYFCADSNRCYLFGIRTEIVDNEETYDTTFAYPCEYDPEKMTFTDFDKVPKVLTINEIGDTLYIDEEEAYIRILPDNKELIRFLDKEFNFDELSYQSFLDSLRAKQ